MRLTDVLLPETIVLNLAAREKVSAIQELATSAAKVSGVRLDDMIRVILEREKLGSTGIGKGVAIPHGKLKSIRNPILGFGLSQEGVDFDALDGLPVYLFFLLITPENEPGVHIKLLSQIAKLMKNDMIKDRLRQSNQPQQIIDILRSEEESIP
jgi:PTS system nitrogen regulatory IIA component